MDDVLDDYSPLGQVDPIADENRDLFGDDDEDQPRDVIFDNDEYQEAGADAEENLEDELEDAELEDADAGPSGAPVPMPTGDVRSRLQQLVQRRRLAEAEPAGKKRKGKDKEGKEKQGKEGKKRKQQGEPAKKPKRPRRATGTEEADGEAGDHEARHGAGPAAGEEEVASDEIEENEGDKEFIDDEGAEQGPGSEGDDDGGGIIVAEEAEEAEGDEDDVTKMLKAKKKKKDKDVNVDPEVKDMLGMMEAAMEADFETVARNLGVELKKDGSGSLVTDQDGYVVASKAAPPKNKSPAIAKLKLLQEVELFMAQKRFHEPFIHLGGLGVLKGWLEPYHDGTLPNVRIRTAILKGLQLLPVDLGLEDHKEILKKSQLGKNVMFLFKCADETPENRRMAKELVHKWSRPIFYDHEAEEVKKQAQTQQALEARRVQLERAHVTAAQAQAIAPRTKATRIGALIPRGSKLDYVNNPGAASDLSAAAEPVGASSGKGSAKQVDFITKRIREVQRKGKESGVGRAAKPSVEGRNIVLTTG